MAHQYTKFNPRRHLSLAYIEIRYSIRQTDSTDTKNQIQALDSSMWQSKLKDKRSGSLIRMRVEIQSELKNLGKNNIFTGL